MSANEWLAKNGICIAQLIKAENELVKAEKLARFLIYHCTPYLQSKEYAVLKRFIDAMNFFGSRKKLSSRHAYKILEICTVIIRKSSKPITKSQTGIKHQKQAVAY